MTETNILASFDAITIDNRNRIGNEDRKVCEEHQKFFEKTIRQIYGWQKTFEKALAENPQPAFRINCNKAYREYSGCDSSISRQYAMEEFSPLFPLEACQKLYKGICIHFESSVINHFNNTYGCRFDSKGIIYNALFPSFVVHKNGYGEATDSVRAPSMKMVLLPENFTVPSYEIIIDSLIEQLGGRTFLQNGKDVKLREFQKHFSSWDQPVKAVKRSVKIPHYVYYSNWDDTYSVRFDYQTKIQNALLAANVISGIESKPRIQYPDSNIGFCAGQKVNVCFSTVESFICFKNGTVQFDFLSPEAAQQFAAICKSLNP